MARSSREGEPLRSSMTPRTTGPSPSNDTRTATFMRRHGANSFTISLALATATFASLSLLAQGPPQPGPPTGAGRPTADFRHFPGGKAVPGLDAGNRAAAGPLAAEANRELPPGVRVPPGARPVVSEVGPNQLYRFALEYEAVPLAAGTDYVAVLHSTGRVTGKPRSQPARDR